MPRAKTDTAPDLLALAASAEERVNTNWFTRQTPEVQKQLLRLRQEMRNGTLASKSIMAIWRKVSPLLSPAPGISAFRGWIRGEQQ